MIRLDIPYKGKPQNTFPPGYRAALSGDVSCSACLHSRDLRPVCRMLRCVASLRGQTWIVDDDGTCDVAVRCCASVAY